MVCPYISDEVLSALRHEVTDCLSPYRARHILAVERMIVRLGALYLPEKIPLCRAAALLHDITKEFSKEKQEEILSQHGILIADADLPSESLYHAATAALLIPERYPALSDPALIDAVRYHTTGRAGMALLEKLLFLADYIDDSRSFPEQVRIRSIFWDKDPAHMSEGARLSHLDETLLLTLDSTLAYLIERRAPISQNSIAFRNALLREAEGRA